MVVKLMRQNLPEPHNTVRIIYTNRNIDELISEQAKLYNTIILR